MKSWKDEYNEEDVANELSLIGLMRWIKDPDHPFEDGQFTVWTDGSWRFLVKQEITAYQVANFVAHFKPESVTVNAGDNVLIIDVEWPQ